MESNLTIFKTWPRFKTWALFRAKFVQVTQILLYCEALCKRVSYRGQLKKRGTVSQSAGRKWKKTHVTYLKANCT